MSILLENVRRRKSHRMAHEIFVLLPPPLAWLGWLLVVAFVLAVSYLALIQVAKKEQVVGVLSAQQDTVGVTVQTAAVIEKVLVNEGQTVALGQPLFVVAESSYAASSAQSVEQEAAKRINLLLQEQEAAKQALPLKYSQQRHQLMVQSEFAKTQLNAIREQLSTLRRRLELAENQLKKTSQIEKQGYTSELEINRQRDNVLMFRQDVESLSQELARQQSADAAIQMQLKELPFLQQTEHATFQAEQHRLETELAAMQKKTAQTVVSPVAGLVDHVRLRVGQDVIPGVPYVKVVPQQSPLQLSLYAPASAAVFIRKDQRVQIRYRDFPYQRFGRYEGTVMRVSRSPMMPGEPALITLSEPSYAIDVALDSVQVVAYGQMFALRPGMVADVDVITERRSMLYWLFEPVLTLSRNFK